jgi:hypothetical protein
MDSCAGMPVNAGYGHLSGGDAWPGFRPEDRITSLRREHPHIAHSRGTRQYSMHTHSASRQAPQCADMYNRRRDSRMTEHDDGARSDAAPGDGLTLETLRELWSRTYNTEGKPDWSHILPYYDEHIHFRDSIQEIHGIEDFTAMTARLTARSGDLSMNVLRVAKQDNEFFLEWEMTISYKKYPSSVLYGASRMTLNAQGKIAEQRDYYDLWGDIFDNIPRFGKAYRKFMKKKFG